MKIGRRSCSYPQLCHLDRSEAKWRDLRFPTSGAKSAPAWGTQSGFTLNNFRESAGRGEIHGYTRNKTANLHSASHPSKLRLPGCPASHGRDDKFEGKRARGVVFVYGLSGEVVEASLGGPHLLGLVSGPDFRANGLGDAVGVLAHPLLRFRFDHHPGQSLRT